VNLLQVKEKEISILHKDGSQETISFENNIESFKLRKKKSIANGIFAGALIGGIAGAGLGFASGDDWLFSASEKAGFAGITGAVAGSAIGGLVGLLKIKIDVGGKSNLTSTQIERLAERGILYPY